MQRVVRIPFALFIVATLLAAVFISNTPEAIYNKELKLTEQLAATIHHNKDDCDAMSDKVGKLVGNNAALILETQKLTPEDRKRGANRYRARGESARATMVDGLLKCQTNAKVKAAIANGPLLLLDWAPTTFSTGLLRWHPRPVGRIEGPSQARGGEFGSETSDAAPFDSATSDVASAEGVDMSEWHIGPVLALPTKRR